MACVFVCGAYTSMRQCLLDLQQFFVASAFLFAKSHDAARSVSGMDVCARSRVASVARTDA